MLSQVAETLRAHRLVGAGDRWVLAVSGGPDSLALMHVMHALAPRFGLGLEVVCVNHGLRREATDEARAVVEAAHALGLDATAIEVDVHAARTAHVSLQDAARRARLGGLESHARARGCQAVALGHTADDQAETVFFRIVRGTGVAGLAGIPYRRGLFVRPLLDVTRAQVIEHLQRARVPFTTDPSNHDRRFARARIRHEWLPALCRENPRISEALVRLAKDAARANVHPKTLPAGLNPRAAATVARLAARGGTARVSVAGGEIEVRYGEVSVQPRRAARRPLTGRVDVPSPGTYVLPGSSHRLRLSLREGPIDPASQIVFADDTLSWPLILRPLAPGDRMRPRGSPGRRKLQDLLVDAKIPRWSRPQLPVLTDSTGEILYVPGLRPSEIARPTGQTSRWVKVEAVSLASADPSAVDDAPSGDNTFQ